MKPRTRVITVVAAAALLTGAVMLLRQQSEPSAPSPRAVGGAAGAAASGAKDPVTASSLGKAPADNRPRVVKSPKGAAGTVHLNSEMELGRVNGVVIQLKDLLPLPAGQTGVERTLTTERYEFLYQRAVDRELTFQAAKREGVELNATQLAALAEAKARRNTGGVPVFDNLESVPEGDLAAFEQRDYSALLLQASLAEKAGVPPRHVGPQQVLAYYKEHQAEYPPLPDEPARLEIEWAKIDKEIREKISATVEAEHHAHFDAWIAGLRNAAKVTPASLE